MQISYGYQNGEVIKMLKERGTLIGNGKSCKKLEKEIMETVYKDSLKITTPVRAFITFRTHEGFERCNKYIGKSKNKLVMYMFDKYPVHFKLAPEPSNIIWENLEITKKTMRRRETFAGSMIIAFIVVCFLVITALKAYSGFSKAKYPVRVDCGMMNKEFTT